MARNDGVSSADSVRLTFNEAIDPTTFTVDDVSSFTGPGSMLLPTGIVQRSSTVFDVTFAMQTAPGMYSFTIGPDIKDVAGNKMNQNNDGTNGGPGDSYHATFTLSNSSTFTFTNSTPVSIVDNKTVVSTITIDQDILISDLNVRFDINHTWDSDLRITLSDRNGTVVTLVNRRGGSGDNFKVTTLNDETTTHIALGTAPFNGSFRPEQPLAVFDGRLTRGTWILSISDLATFDVGVLNSWSLIVTGDSLGPPPGGPGGLSIGDTFAPPTLSFGDAVTLSFGGARNLSFGGALLGSEPVVSTPAPATSASFNPFGLFSVGEEDDREEVTESSAAVAEREMATVLAFTDDAMRRQQSMDSIFADEDGVGGEGEDAGEGEVAVELAVEA